MLKKAILGFLASLVVLTSSLVYFVPNAKASAWYSQTYEEWLTKVVDSSNPDEIFGERYTAAQVQWVIYGLVLFLSTAGEQELFSCLLEPNKKRELIVDQIIENIIPVSSSVHNPYPFFFCCLRHFVDGATNL